jgi:sugar phosphate isomerase/epimerase
MKLGIVTYMWGAEWDLPTLIKNCELTGFEGVELRTTHKHGVEVALKPDERLDVRKRFADSKVECVGLGSTCEYHSPDAAVLKKQIALTKEFVLLAHDVGATGVKVRPNSLVDGEDREKTVARIGMALRECGQFAEGHGVEIRVEVHGKGTQDPDVMRQIMEIAEHPAVRTCWNSNPGEVMQGSVKHSFDLLEKYQGQVVHIHDLYDPQYPYRELFGLLHKAKFDGYTLSESPATTDTVRVMHYYRALWLELTRGAGFSAKPLREDKPQGKK